MSPTLKKDHATEHLSSIVVGDFENGIAFNMEYHYDLLLGTIISRSKGFRVQGLGFKV